MENDIEASGGNQARPVVTQCSKLALDAVRPLLRRLPRGAGTIYRRLGGYGSSAVWTRYGLRTVKGVVHGKSMRLDLGNAVERETYYLGRFYEWELECVLREMVREGDTFVDVGANIGMVSLHASSCVGGSGKVLSFEPNPTARARLDEHVRINNITNVQVFDVALGSAPGRATLSTKAEHTGTGTLRSLDTSMSSYDVRVACLDEFIDQVPSDRNVFVKIDTEGYDFNVLKGATQLLKRPGVTVFAEVNHKWLGELGQTAEQMFAYMADQGFSAYYPALEAGLLGRRLSPEPLALPGPHHWFNALFLRDDPAAAVHQP